MTEKKKTKPAAKKAVKKTVSKVATVDKQLEELQKLAQEEKYSNQVYEEGKNVEIDGRLWSDIISEHARSVNTVNNMVAAFESILKTYTQVQHNQNVLTVSLMENHMRLVDEGCTITMEKPEEDASDNK